MFLQLSLKTHIQSKILNEIISFISFFFMYRLNNLQSICAMYTSVLFVSADAGEAVWMMEGSAEGQRREERRLDLKSVDAASYIRVFAINPLLVFIQSFLR